MEFTPIVHGNSPDSVETGKRNKPPGDFGGGLSLELADAHQAGPPVDHRHDPAVRSMASDQVDFPMSELEAVVGYLGALRDVPFPP